MCRKCRLRLGTIRSDIGFYWPGFSELGGRLLLVGALLVREMLNWRNWYVIWPMWWISVIIGFSSTRKLFKSQKKQLSVLGLMSLGYVGVYLFSTLDPVGYVGSSADRIMLQLLPLWWPMLGWGNESNRHKQTTIT